MRFNNSSFKLQSNHIFSEENVNYHPITNPESPFCTVGGIYLENRYKKNFRVGFLWLDQKVFPENLLWENRRSGSPPGCPP